MQKTYILSVEKTHILVDLDLPLMTLKDAESKRDWFASFGKTVLVRNQKAI